MASADDAEHRPRRYPLDAALRWRDRLVSSPSFQSWASRTPIARYFARKDAEAIFDLVSGFVHSQVLLACVETGILNRLRNGPLTSASLAKGTGIEPRRMQALCQAAASLELLVRSRDGKFRLGRLGAASMGVPGLEEMIRHHRDFYEDLSDPRALLRGDRSTRLSQIWPYVLSSQAAPNPAAAATYSKLMSKSQAMVADETLRTINLSSATHLLDVGGGDGTFLCAVADRYPDLQLTLFDLPDVVALADPGRANLNIIGGSFQTDDLPKGADTISLVRILYDHSDQTVQALLNKIQAALPAGGRVVISEPMSGGNRPNRATDAYFAFYTLAMGTGQVRTTEEIASLLQRTGFVATRAHRTARPFVTQVITARKPN